MLPGKKAAGSVNGRQATLCGVPRIGLAERFEADQRRSDWMTAPTGTEFERDEGTVSSQGGCNVRRKDYGEKSFL